MGLCINCVYHTQTSRNQILPNGCLRPSGHYCSNENNYRTDFVTGEIYYADCYEKNNFEECLFYEEPIEIIEDNNEESNDEETESDNTDNIIEDNEESGD